MKKKDFLEQTKKMWNEIRIVNWLKIAKVTFRWCFVYINDEEKDFDAIVDNLSKYKRFQNINDLRLFMKNT
jgi:hypothetical protein